jgi:hypothetical protein
LGRRGRRREKEDGEEGLCRLTLVMDHSANSPAASQDGGDDEAAGRTRDFMGLGRRWFQPQRTLVELGLQPKTRLFAISSAHKGKCRHFHSFFSEARVLYFWRVVCYYMIG